MRYIIECDIEDFEAWQGGAETLDEIKKYDEENGTKKIAELNSMANDLGLLNEDDINDWLWFDVPEMEEFSEVFQ